MTKIGGIFFRPDLPKMNRYNTNRKTPLGPIKASVACSEPPSVGNMKHSLFATSRNIASPFVPVVNYSVRL
jgi:hypothetical protein